MILKAIITQLITGSVKNVYSRGNMETYPAGKGTAEILKPYVVVYVDYAINAYYTVNNTVTPYVIDAHWPVGYIDELNAYIENEVATLLNWKRLTDASGYVFQTFMTMNLGPMVEPNDDRSISSGNDDKTISRTRRIIVPNRGL